VFGAEEYEIVDCGAASVGPVVDVVGLAVGGGLVAGGVYAADISSDYRSADARWNDAAGAADVEWFALAAEHHRYDGGVAGDPSCRFHADRGAGVEGRMTVS
jgi:hypothetical protein